ncbi:MAG: NmrA family transcriptional regulator, partial [Blastocatellia bacterium]
IKESSIPHSIVHATQFFEFVNGMIDDASVKDGTTGGNTVRVPPVLIQPMAAEDVAIAVARVATGSPLNGTVEVGGPEQFHYDELLRRALRARNVPRQVLVDPKATYFGAEVTERTLVPGKNALLGKIRFDDWLRGSQQATVAAKS